MADAGRLAVDICSDEEVEDCSEAFTVSFRIVKSALEEIVFSMQLDRSMTPLEVCEIWEKTWGVDYASRIKFEAPPDHGSRWLNHRSDVVPAHPVVIKLVGPSSGSILERLLLVARRCGATREESRRGDENVRRKELPRSSKDDSAKNVSSRAFSRKLEALKQCQDKQNSQLEEQRVRHEKELSAQRELESAQELRRLEFQRRLRFLEQQHARDWEREQLDIQECRNRKVAEQQAAEERLEKEQQERREREERQKQAREEQERREREEQARIEKENHERQVRLAALEKERTEREKLDPKFQAAMEARRARQEKNRLRQAAQAWKAKEVNRDGGYADPIASDCINPEGLFGQLREQVAVETVGSNTGVANLRMSERPITTDNNNESAVDSPTCQLVEVFSLNQAKSLQNDLLVAFSESVFQMKLRQCSLRYGSSSTEFCRERQKLVAEVQMQVIPRYGFSGDPAGVAEMMLAMTKQDFTSDVACVQAGAHIAQLLEPPLHIAEGMQTKQAALIEANTSKRAGVFRMPGAFGRI